MGYPLIWVQKSKIDLDWSMIGNIHLIKKHSDLSLKQYLLDCHHQVDLFPKLGNWCLLIKVDNDLSLVKPADLISSI